MAQYWRCAIPTSIIRQRFSGVFPLILVTPDVRTAQELIVRAHDLYIDVALTMRTQGQKTEYGVLTAFKTQEDHDRMLAWLASNDAEALQWKELGYRLEGHIEIIEAEQ